MIISSSSRVTLDHLSRLPIFPTLRHVRCLASEAYFPPPIASSLSGPRSASSPATVPSTRSTGGDTAPPDPATTGTPANLTAKQKELIARIIRVDQAGEVGANWIYRGQKMAMQVRGDKKAAKQIEVSSALLCFGRAS